MLISIRRSVSSWILSALAQNRKLRIRVDTNFRALGITALSLARTHARTLDTTDSSRDRYTYIIVNVTAWQIPSCHTWFRCKLPRRDTPSSPAAAAVPLQPRIELCNRAFARPPHLPLVTSCIRRVTVPIVLRSSP